MSMPNDLSAESDTGGRIAPPVALPEVPSPFLADPPRVQLLREESAAHPFATTVAAAWSCYGARPASVGNVRRLVYGPEPAGANPVKAADREVRRERAIRLYSDLFAAGHHTTFQHATFVFVLDNVSRLAIWSFFHSHPNYNSEQVSQRYREVTGDTVGVPDLPAAERAVYEEAVRRSLDGYRRLTELLTPDMAARYGQVFPSRVRATGPEAERRVADAVQKRAQEVARYVLPLAAPAHLYHTVNGLTLLRYAVLAGQPDAPSEVRWIVREMLAQVLEVDPYFLGGPGHPLDLRPAGFAESAEGQALAAWQANAAQGAAESEAFCREFDAALGPWRQSRLAGYNPDAERTLAAAARAVLGKTEAALPDAEAIGLVLDGRRNPTLGHALYLGMHDKLLQTMNHVPFTFRKRLSGAEDAQNQRHRTTLSSSPVLAAHLRREPDVIVPWALRGNPAALAEYEATIGAMWAAKNRLQDAGVEAETLLRLLPNAHRVRFFESGTLLGYYWKWVKRLCFDAQREIFETALEEVAQVREVLPLIGAHVDGPPCVMRSRSGARPICPEGERYCGVPVWRGHRFEDLEGRRVM